MIDAVALLLCNYLVHCCTDEMPLSGVSLSAWLIYLCKRFIRFLHLHLVHYIYRKPSVRFDSFDMIVQWRGHEDKVWGCRYLRIAYISVYWLMAKWHVFSWIKSLPNFITSPSPPHRFQPLTPAFHSLFQLYTSPPHCTQNLLYKFKHYYPLRTYKYAPLYYILEATMQRISQIYSYSSLCKQCRMTHVQCYIGLQVTTLSSVSCSSILLCPFHSHSSVCRIYQSTDIVCLFVCLIYSLLLHKHTKYRNKLQ